MTDRRVATLNCGSLPRSVSINVWAAVMKSVYRFIKCRHSDLSTVSIRGFIRCRPFSRPSASLELPVDTALNHHLCCQRGRYLICRPFHGRLFKKVIIPSAKEIVFVPLGICLKKRWKWWLKRLVFIFTVSHSLWVEHARADNELEDVLQGFEGAEDGLALFPATGHVQVPLQHWHQLPGRQRQGRHFAPFQSN